MQCKLISKKYIGTDKLGQPRYFTNFYLEFENGCKVAIKPSFENGFYALKSLATYVEDKNNENK